MRCSSEPATFKKNALLYQMLQCSRPMWLLSRLLNFDSTMDFHLLSDLWQTIGHNYYDMLILFKSKQSSEQYARLRDRLKEDDQPAETVAEFERQYFRKDVLGLQISRKLSLVSEWSSRYGKPFSEGIRGHGNAFVADKRLWIWIEQCIIQPYWPRQIQPHHKTAP
jgi:hypothetical protein